VAAACTRRLPYRLSNSFGQRGHRLVLAAPHPPPKIRNPSTGWRLFALVKFAPGALAQIGYNLFAGFPQAFSQ
jgi:hypothetical protein